MIALEETAMKVTGGWHCGQITYEPKVDPATVRVCHCTDCQKQTGTAFHANIVITHLGSATARQTGAELAVIALQDHG